MADVEQVMDQETIMDIIFSLLDHKAASARIWYADQAQNKDQESYQFEVVKSLINLAHFAPVLGIVDDIYTKATDYFNYPDTSLLMDSFNAQLFAMWRSNPRRMRNRFQLLHILCESLDHWYGREINKVEPVGDDKARWEFTCHAIIRACQMIGFDYQSFRETAERFPRINALLPQLEY